MLIRSLKAVMSETIIVLGGPEVSFEFDYLFDLGADIIVPGEGEAAFLDICENPDKFTRAKIQRTVLKYEPVGLSALPFAHKDVNDNEQRILYYESQRGCPFKCGYCLSPSFGNFVDYLPIKRVLTELDFFIDKKVRQVKFVDRSFNFNKTHAMSIWKHLISRGGETNFHFEVEGRLLDQDMFSLLEKAPTGLFQFEIGVQSTNQPTLSAIGRTMDDRLFENINRLLNLGNIHIHLDLIAGLPLEDFSAFRQSFNDVFALKPDMLQLGFLKLLRGSRLSDQAKQFGLVACEHAPYEILKTDALSFLDLTRLKWVCRVVNMYYNKGHFGPFLDLILPRFESAFDMFLALGTFYVNQGFDQASHGRAAQYEILRKFCEQYDEIDLEVFDELLMKEHRHDPKKPR